MAVYSKTNEQGSEFEIFIVDVFKKIGFPDARRYCIGEKFSDWDVSADLNNIVTAELKDDWLAHHTYNNICIETGQYGKSDDIWTPSGIFITKAVFWIHCNGIRFNDATIYLAYVNEVKKLVYLSKQYKNKFNQILKLNLGRFDGISGSTANKIRDELIDELNKSVKNKYPNIADDILKTDFKFRHPVEQGDGDYKYMDLCLIPNHIFPKYCFEISGKNDITYKEIIGYYNKYIKLYEKTGNI